MGGLLIPELSRLGIIPSECIHLERWRSRHVGKIHPLGTAFPRESLTVTPPNIGLGAKGSIGDALTIQFLPMWFVLHKNITSYLKSPRLIEHLQCINHHLFFTKISLV